MPNLQSFVARAHSHFLKNGMTSVTMATLFWKRSWREDTDGSRSSRRTEFSSQMSPGAVQVSTEAGSMCSTTNAGTKVGASRGDAASAGSMYAPYGRCHDRHGARWSDALGHEHCQKRHVRRVRHYHMRVQRRAAVLADALILEPKKPRAGTPVPVSSSRRLVVLFPHPTLRQPQLPKSRAAQVRVASSLDDTVTFFSCPTQGEGVAAAGLL